MRSTCGIFSRFIRVGPNELGMWPRVLEREYYFEN